MSPAPPSRLRWWVCGLLLLATTLNYMDRITLNQTADRIMTAFDLNKERYGLVESTFSVAFGLGTLACGWLVDRVSVRRVYPVLVLGWSAAGFLTGSVSEVWALFACRFALGLFEAGNWPCGVRTTRAVLAPQERSLGNSLFQSGTALGAVLTPLVVILCNRVAGPDDPEAWRLPFRVIGLLGVGWVALWVFTLPQGLVDAKPAEVVSSEPFSLVLRDRRFWLLVLVVIGVNTAWQTGRVWLPLFLKERRGFAPDEVQGFMAGYYLVADVGSWTVGFATLGLTWRGVSVHRSRVISFAACVLLVAGAAALSVATNGYMVAALLLAFGFGALGLFPTYLALSQELSARHQGKVTGSLGFVNALYLAGLYWVQGLVMDATGAYEWVLAAAGVPAVVALAAVVAYWPAERSP